MLLIAVIPAEYFYLLMETQFIVLYVINAIEVAVLAVNFANRAESRAWFPSLQVPNFGFSRLRKLKISFRHFRAVL